MSYQGSWAIDDLLTFYCNTQSFTTGNATDADSPPIYRVYEDETTTPLLTGSMALLDGTNTAGFYSEQITLSAANGFERGKSYSIYIAATVGGIAGTMSHNFQVQAEVDVRSWVGGAIPAPAVTGIPKVDLLYVIGTILSESAAGRLAGAIIKWFNVVSPTGTVNSIPDAIAGAANGLALVGSNMGSVTSVSGNVGGSIGSLAAQAKTDVADATWDAPIVDHLDPGSTGATLNGLVPGSPIIYENNITEVQVCDTP